MKYYLGIVTHGEVKKYWFGKVNNRVSNIKLIMADSKEKAETKLRIYAIENNLVNTTIKIQDTL